MIRFHLLLAAALVLAVTPLGAQDGAGSGRPVVGKEQLLRVLEQAKGWAKDTTELRSAAKDLDARKIAARADAIRSGIDGTIVLMATTEPPAEWKQAAVLLQMGVKGVELALWHYLYAAIAAYEPGVEHGDVLLKAALGQITGAEKLFSR